MTNQGRILGARRTQGILISLHVIVPERALGVIGFADLPVAVRVFEPLGEAGELLLLADMQEEFQDVRTVFEEFGLEIADLLVARLAGRPRRSLYARA